MDQDLYSYLSAEIQRERSEYESSAVYQMHKARLLAELEDLTARVNAERSLQASTEAAKPRSL